MKISAEAKDFADAFYFEKGREIYNKSQEKLKNRKFINFEDSTQADFSNRIESTAKMIEARIESYILAYEKEGKLIDDEDKEEIFEEIKRFIKQQCQQAFSNSQGLLTMVRNQWSKEYSSQMREYFDSKVKQLMEPALLKLNLKMREMNMNKMMEQNKNKQYEVLRWIFDKAEGSQNDLVDLLELTKENSTYEINDLEKITDYLEGENLIKRPIDEGIFVQLTHKGIVEIQSSINNPQKPTKYFPATVIQNFTFNSAVGSFQTGSQSIANVQQNFGSKTEDVINLLKELREHVSDDNKQEGLALIESLEKEVKLEKRSEPTIKLFLKGIGNFVKDTGKDILVEIGKKLIVGDMQ